MTIKSILIKYWGYSSFRPLQEDIIKEILKGRDTLALLPTGGGKSICFQVPGLVNEGLTLVVTPLIALMKDQVENLKKKGIKAAALHSGLHRNEIDVVIDNCIFGDTKFLYVSPERLESPDFREVLKRMKVNIIAVDEAHCISQWGYDFRPPYLNIAEIRTILPRVPVLALTATATTDVVDDIQEKLNFKQRNLIRGSFERKNLTYIVSRNENKNEQLLKILQSISGTGIIYVRSRRHTREIFEFLSGNNISADYYHAGLGARERSNKQDAWMKGSRRIMVATNAFGMGIDKSNVRLVIHLDLPDSLEAYFQEAGRAGRDGKQSYAITIFDDADIDRLKLNYRNSFPEIEKIRMIYHAMGNYFQLAVGSGKDASFDFDLSHFSRNYEFPPLLVFNALKFLEKEGYLVMTEAIENPSKVFVKAGKNDLYRFQVENPLYDKFIKLLLRSYSGLFSDFVVVNENELASRLNTEAEKVIAAFQYLDKIDVLSYIPRTNQPQIIFTKERLDKKELLISKENYRDRKNAAEKRYMAVVNYVTSGHVCRSQFLLNYFGEKSAKRCGKCDVCKERNKVDINDLEFDQISERIRKALQYDRLTIYALLREIKEARSEKVISIIQWLKDNDRIIEKDGLLQWKWQTSMDI